jgi:hypothetical protein
VNPRDAALAVGITSLCAAVAWTMVNSDPPPMVGTSTSEVTYTVAPTTTVTATATVTARPTATRTVTVSRSRERVAGIQARIRWCESRNNYRAENPNSTASGAYQFLDGTWRSVTGLEPPASAYPPAVQDTAFVKLYAQLGTKPWIASQSCWK